MATDQNSKFPLHEAARDGKRMISDLNIPNLMLTSRSSNGRIALECKFRPAYSGISVKIYMQRLTFGVG